MEFHRGETGLRESLKSLDPDLWHKSQTIWIDAKTRYHDAQVSKHGHSQGTNHCQRVEQILSQLIPDHWRGENKKVTPMELFILTVSAAFHDIRKRLGEIRPHAEAAAEDIKNDPERFHLDDHTAKAVSEVVRVHGGGNLSSVSDEAFSINLLEVNLREIAALFSLADALDCDELRVQKETSDEAELKALENMVTLFRKRNSGPHIHDNGHISIIVTPKNLDELKTVEENRAYLIAQEFNPVISILKEAGYPFHVSIQVSRDEIKEPVNESATRFNKAMIITVGTGVGQTEEAMKRAKKSLTQMFELTIKRSNPDVVFFVVTEESRIVLELFMAEYSYIPSHQVIQLSDADDMHTIVDELSPLFKEIRERYRNIEVDFTSGTKAMSASMVLCGLIFKCNALIHNVTRIRKGGTADPGSQSIQKSFDPMFIHNLILQEKKE